MMTTTEILNLLPYSQPFLFVDELHEVNEDGATGSYTFKVDEYFYKGHFKDCPITPGVILTEAMAQIAVITVGIFLGQEKIAETFSMPDIALTSTAINFHAPVFPGERVIVTSQKNYFRFGKLSCDVKMMNSTGKVVCSGNISGILKSKKCE